MILSVNKTQLLDRAIDHLQKQMDLLIHTANEAKAASTHEESKAENKYDTRGLEASYLAAGQSQRVLEIKETLFLLKKMTPREYRGSDPIGITALVHLSCESLKDEPPVSSETRWVFLLPIGGLNLAWEQTPIQTMSLSSPVGRALLDSFEGDSFQIKNKEYSILKVI